ncbi:universal stress protein UspA [Halobiforma lacisalsi AJ5]|uniref:Universal stress protein UspA n=1 Tax=Natronobacterium lacisalsi AJ5 TaxID=358396 RepID=M0LWD3_NATLA|nr:universal stress protein [Halobiforma lacisalsi]APW97363.1 universal stress protein UspA [Halobiforma lacisalsi AJ5]EMA37887.1 UspA domain-containing protein [Halobiforma lacisalsi AJ5]
MFDTVVVATDGSESVERAVDVALDLADRFDAEIHALSVVDASQVDASPQQLREELRTALETTADAALATVEERTDEDREIETAVREGRPASEICEYAREIDADVIATGTRGRHGENRLLLGSVAERVVRTSPVPVLTVRQLDPMGGDDAETETETETDGAGAGAADADA